VERYEPFTFVFEVDCGDAKHEVALEPSGEIVMRDHDLATVEAFTKFGAKMPDCLRIYRIFYNTGIEATAISYSSSYRRPFAPIGRFEDHPVLTLRMWSYGAGLSLPSDLGSAMLFAVQELGGAAVHALNVYKMPEQGWPKTVEFQANFTLARRSHEARVAGQGKRGSKGLAWRRGDAERLMILDSSLGAYAEVLNTFPETELSPRGTFWINKGMRGAVATIKRWFDDETCVVVAGRPGRGFNVDSRHAVVRRSESAVAPWRLVRWL
jgi:hypothetical protein